MYRILRRGLPILLCLVAVAAWGQKVKMKTVYNDKRYFVSDASIAIDAPVEASKKVFDRLVHDMTTYPPEMFNWICSDLGFQGDSNDPVYLEYRSCKYNAKTGDYSITFDIQIPHLKTFHDVCATATIKIVDYVSGNKLGDVKIHYTNLVLKDAGGLLKVITLPNNQSQVDIHFQIKFGWFFNLFITRERYRKIFEWRFERFLQNYAKYARIEAAKMAKAEKEQEK